MYFMEYEATESDVLTLIQESASEEGKRALKEQIIDPIMEVLGKPAGRNAYIRFGSEFIEANAEMLAKEYPTKAVVFPRKYVDNVLALFGFTSKSLKETLLPILRTIKNRDSANFHAIVSAPSNVIHIIALFYSDIIIHRLLRDSARQQLGLSIYHFLFLKYFSSGYNESVMAYTYMHLNGVWNIVKCEDMVSWIGNNIDTAYATFRTRMTVDMSPEILTKSLSGIISSFNQSMRSLSQKYYENLNNDKVNTVGSDVSGDDEYLISNNFIRLRDNLMRMIKSGDQLYKNNGKLYAGVARLKNVKTDTLYNFAQKVENADISKIIDNILYVFLIKEGNTVEDINSTKYIGRITNMPTAVDRAIQGKPIILPMTKKYKVDSSIVKAYICLIATYILNRVNDAK